MILIYYRPAKRSGRNLPAPHPAPPHQPAYLAASARAQQQQHRHVGPRFFPVSDKGRTNEAIRMGTAMRILFHDNLIGRIGGRRCRLISTCEAVDARTFRYHGLVKFVMRDGKHSVEPVLGDRRIEGSATVEMRGLRLQTHGPILTPTDTPPSDPNAVRYLRVHKWWNETVFVFSPGVTLTRREIALPAANEDGGAHVDREIDRKYARLVEGGADILMGHHSADPEPLKFSSIHLAALRQIAFEILSSRELFALGSCGDSSDERNA